MRKEITIKLRQLNTLVRLLRERPEGLTKEEVEDTLRRIEEEILHISKEAEEIEKASVTTLARRRAVVLAITVLIELGVAFAIAPFEKTIAKFAALYVFSPLVSAVSGNHGLQTAAIVIRALAVGTVENRIKVVLREMAVGLLCGLTIGLFAGLVAYFTTGLWIAIPVLTLALLAGMFTSGFMGAVIPQVMQWLGFDPAIVAGPAETALQDLASYFTFLLVLTLLSRWL